MGRHSAPDPQKDGAAPVEVSETLGPEALGLETPGSGTPGSEVPGSDAPTGRASSSALAPGSRGDLQLLRADGGLRLRCAGAVVLTFLIYTAVLILMGRSDVYVIWLWIPIVVSGVVIGGLLDHAHGARDRSG